MMWFTVENSLSTIGSSLLSRIMMYFLALICLLHRISWPTPKDKKFPYTIILLFPCSAIVFILAIVLDLITMKRKSRLIFEYHDLKLLCIKITIFYCKMQSVLDNKDFLAHIFDIISFSLSLHVIVFSITSFEPLNQVCQTFLSLRTTKTYQFGIFFFFFFFFFWWPKSIFPVIVLTFAKYWLICFSVDQDVCTFLLFKISKICFYFIPFYLILIILLYILW